MAKTEIVQKMHMGLLRVKQNRNSTLSSKYEAEQLVIEESGSVGSPTNSTSDIK